MRRIRLEAKPDHIMRLAGVRDPVRAVAELIWNGVDAEATHVSVRLSYNDMDGVDTVTVADNGHGMNSQESAMHFAGLGGSWKAAALVSPTLQRPLHGRSGQGRLRAFALGNQVKWSSVGASITGGNERTVVTGSANSPADFAIEDAIGTSDETGTVFESSNPARYVNRLANDSTAAKLAAIFALYLLVNPSVKIEFEGRDVDPSAVWIDSTEGQVPGRGVWRRTRDLRVVVRR